MIKKLTLICLIPMFKQSKLMILILSRLKSADHLLKTKRNKANNLSILKTSERISPDKKYLMFSGNSVISSASPPDRTQNSKRNSPKSPSPTNNQPKILSSALIRMNRSKNYSMKKKSTLLSTRLKPRESLIWKANKNKLSSSNKNNNNNPFFHKWEPSIIRKWWLTEEKWAWRPAFLAINSTNQCSNNSTSLTNSRVIKVNRISIITVIRTTCTTIDLIIIETTNLKTEIIQIILTITITTLDTSRKIEAKATMVTIATTDTLNPTDHKPTWRLKAMRLRDLMIVKFLIRKNNLSNNLNKKLNLKKLIDKQLSENMNNWFKPQREREEPGKN